MRRAVLLSVFFLLALAGNASAVLVYQQPVTQAIVAARDDGSGAKVIAHGSYPAVSLDGRRVAFLASSNTVGSTGPARLVATSGGPSRQLLRNSFAVTSRAAVWSPDDRHLLVGSTSGAWLIDVVHHRRRLIPIEDGYGGAMFSEDGLRVLVDDLVPHGEEYVAESRLGTRTVKKLPGRGLPVWGKGGLAYAESDETHGDRGTFRRIVLRKKLEGRARVLLRTGPQLLYPVAWSAGGTRLLVAEGQFDGSSLRAALIDPNTGGVQTLPIAFSAIEGLSRDGTRVLGEMGGNVVSVGVAGDVRVLAQGATSPSWTAGAYL
jgi:hypothetical protein